MVWFFCVIPLRIGSSGLGLIFVRLQDQVTDLEQNAATPQAILNPSVSVVLVAHSMGCVECRLDPACKALDANILAFKWFCCN